MRNSIGPKAFRVDSTKHEELVVEDEENVKSWRSGVLLRLTGSAAWCWTRSPTSPSARRRSMEPRTKCRCCPTCELRSEWRGALCGLLLGLDRMLPTQPRGLLRWPSLARCRR